MKQELKIRLATVVDALQKLAEETNPIYNQYHNIDLLLSELAKHVPDDQHKLLFQAAELITKAFILAVKSKTTLSPTTDQTVVGKVLQYKHDPDLLINHENDAKKKLEQLGTEPTTELATTYSEKLQATIEQNGVSPDDMKSLLHVFNK